jgi:hypothetical protein
MSGITSRRKVSKEFKNKVMFDIHLKESFKRFSEEI